MIVIVRPDFEKDLTKISEDDAGKILKALDDFMNTYYYLS